MPQLETWTREGYLATSLQWVTARLVVTYISPIKCLNGLLILCSRSCEGHEMLRSRRRCLVRSIWT